MAEDASAWKQRYELALEAIERTARDNRDFTQELVRALNRLTLACEGQDSSLDVELRELRAFLRLKALSREVLASKIDVQIVDPGATSTNDLSVTGTVTPTAGGSVVLRAASGGSLILRDAQTLKIGRAHV